MAGDKSDGNWTYGTYLELDRLLQLQGDDRGVSRDEMHFIIVHQTFELWFKQVIRELAESRDTLSSEQVAEEMIPSVVHRLGRVTEIFRLMAQQWSVMETLTPQDFLTFRDRLGTSSGFESWQLRQIEIILGLEQQQRDAGMDPVKHMERLEREGKVSSEVLIEFREIIASPSLNELLGKWLFRTPINGSFPNDKGDEKSPEQPDRGRV